MLHLLKAVARASSALDYFALRQVRCGFASAQRAIRIILCA
jgi:hypothetical protein